MAISNITITSLAAFEFQDTANSNVVIAVKASSGTIYMLQVDNSALAAVVFCKVWDSAGVITLGTTDPDFIFKVPASTRVQIVWAPGQAFSAGLQVATVTSGGTAGVTAPATPPTVRIVYS